MTQADRQAEAPVQTVEPGRQTGGFNDERMEAIMGRILQTGVLLASSIVLLGGVMHLLANRSGTPRYRTFHPDPYKLSLLHAEPLMTGIAHGHPEAILQLGILLLIATPIARVICAVVGFSFERDRLYVGVSAAVLAVLIWGMLRGG